MESKYKNLSPDDPLFQGSSAADLALEGKLRTAVAYAKANPKPSGKPTLIFYREPALPQNPRSVYTNIAAGNPGTPVA